MNQFIFFVGNLISAFSRKLNLGNGSTWPGHIALFLNKNFVTEILNTRNVQTVFVVGTNGKTTTSKLLATILEKNNIKTMLNSSGANLLNGVASSLIINSAYLKGSEKKLAILEIDENALSVISKIVEPDYLIALNLFRDQLDRYGEIDSISGKWKETINNYKNTILILNSDDPQIAFLGFKTKLKCYYFGLDEKALETKVVQHGADSIICPNCTEKLIFDCFYFSHLGKWSCPKCGFKRPMPNISSFSVNPLSGTYAKYDILASVMLSKILKIDEKKIQEALESFVPAFGRQEEITYKNKKIKIFLSKNPISFNESLDTIIKLKGKNFVFALNDKIPDGLDVSWIWDIDFERLLEKDINVFVCGDRAYDMSLRLKYTECFNQVFEDFEQGISKILDNLESNETLYILPNYSAMLDIRKTLTGKKIL